MAEHGRLAAPGARGFAQITVDQKSFETVMKLLKNADADLYRETRRSLLASGKKVKTAQQAAVRGLSTGGGGGSRGGGAKVRALFAARVTAANALTGTLSASQVRRANRSTGLRDAAANAVAVEVRERPSARVRKVGVTVRMRSSQMPPGQRRLPKHMNYGRWRHPVFGRDAWVTQTASPQGWFDGTFKEMKADAIADISAAIDKAWAGLN